MQSTGKLLYLSTPGTPTAEDTFSYATSDGDFYRTATVTVSVEGFDVVAPALTRKLVKKHGHVQRRARLSGTNTNTRPVRFFAGHSRIDVRRSIVPGGTVKFRTRRAVLFFFVLVKNDAGDRLLVDSGRINIRTGKVLIFKDDFRTARTQHRSAPREGFPMHLG